MKQQKKQASITLFYSYASTDREWRDQLVTHLSQLKHDGLIEELYDQQILAGEEYARERDRMLRSAQIILLLISADFLASDACYQDEMQQALERHRTGVAHVIPILVRPCDWQHSPFAHLQCFPRNTKPITTWGNQDEAFSDIAKGIREAVQTTREAQRESTSLSARVPLMEPLVVRYRTALHGDARIAHLQVLGMSRSLEIMNIYVRVRVQEPRKLGYAPDPTLLAAERQRDPNMVMMMRRQWHDNSSEEILSPEEAIGKYKHCVLIGDPGAGKTTLLKYLTLQAVDGKLHDLPNLPLHIDLNAFAASGCSHLQDFAAQMWHERYGLPFSEVHDLIHQKLEAGNVILLLDALDETVIGERNEEADASYTRVADAIMLFATRYRQIPIVVTARKAAYLQHILLVGFTVLEVLDFSVHDIEQFIHNWFAPASTLENQQKITELIASLDRNPRMQTLAANPLLLLLIVNVYESQQSLPDKPVALYKECMDILLTEWDARRGLSRHRAFGTQQKYQLLTAIAWHFHQQGQSYFREHDLLRAIADAPSSKGLSADQCKDMLQEIASESGLLKEQAHGWYGFLHLTLQEYCVAQYTTYHHQLDILLQHVGDPWWEEVLLQYAGNVSDASILLHKLLGKDIEGTTPDDIFYTNLQMAGRCLTVHPTVQQEELREKVIERLCTLLTGNQTPYIVQYEIRKILKAIKGTTVSRCLLHTLLDKQQLKEVRKRSASRELGELGDQSIVPNLRNLLDDTNLDIEIRWSIVEALGKLGDRAAVPSLLRILDETLLMVSEKSLAKYQRSLGGRELHIDDNLRKVMVYRLQIVEALCRLYDHTLAPQLLALLINRPSYEYTQVSETITKTLVESGDPSLVPQMLAMLSDEHLNVRGRAFIVDVLTGSHVTHRNYVSTPPGIFVRSTGAKPWLSKQSVISHLLHLLDNPSLHVMLRVRVIDALVTLGEYSVVSQLLTLQGDEHQDGEAQSIVTEAFIRLSDQSMIPQLLDLFANRKLDTQVRIRVAKKLTELGERTFAPDLLVFLKEQQDGRVRTQIANLLGMVGDQSIIHELLYLAYNNNRYPLRMHLSEALAKLANRAILPQSQLVSLLLDKRLAFIRWDIIHALGALDDVSIVPDLLQLLTTERDQDVHRCVVIALGEIGDRSAVPYLLPLLVKKRGFWRVIDWSVASALYEIGDQSIAPDLLAAFANTNNNHGWWGPKPFPFLSTLSDPSIVPVLRRLLRKMYKYDDDDACLAITNALVRLGDPSVVVSDLLQLLRQMPGGSGRSIDRIVEALVRLRLDDQRIVPSLRCLLPRLSVINALGELANDEATVKALVQSLAKPPSRSHVDDIYSALWRVSRRAGMQVFVIGPSIGMGTIKLVRWSS